MLKNYFITALRNLWRNKFFSLINIFGLSLGIACCMLIFLYAKDELTFDRFHQKADRIYRITIDMTDKLRGSNKSGNSGLIQGPSFRQGVPEIEEFVRLQSANCDVKHKGDIFSQEGLWADENFFSMFSFPLLYGDPKSALKDMHSVVISEDLAIKYFGKKEVVGKSLVLNTKKEFNTFVVSAVAKNSPQNSSIKIQMLLPMKFQLSQDKEKPHWMNFFLNTFVLLKPGSNVKAVTDKCNYLYKKEAAPQIKEMKEKYGFNETVAYSLQPLLAMHLSKDYPPQNGLVNASSPIYSYILSGIAIFVLIIACINFINLTVARSLKRAKEIGVRKVVGSLQKQLIIQFLGESFILSFFSFTFAIVLVAACLPFFNSVSNKALAFSYLPDLKLVIAFISLFLITSLLAGFYPALVLSRFKPVETLYGKLRYSGKNYLSRSLVVLQFALATVLIISTITIYSQFDYLVNYNLGYDKSNVLTVNAGKMNKLKLEALKTELLREPSVKKITARQGGGYVTIANINGATQQEFGFNLIDEEHFPMFKVPVLKGRNFSRDFPGDSTTSVIVNETFVKAAGWKNPIGEIIDFYYNKKKYNVIGVVRDFHTGPLTEKITPQVFSVDPQISYQVLLLKIDPAGKTAALRHTEKIVRQFFPLIPYTYSFLDEDLQDQYKNEARWRQIITFSAALTIFISCIGLFGLAALSAEKRSKEIGIRKVLGASVLIITRKLSADFLKLVTLASLIALPVAWWAMDKWLENYPYRIKLSYSLFVFAVCSVLLLSLITVSYQSIKAAVANPVRNLRTE
jgi:putative ABC transport system permease protein